MKYPFNSDVSDAWYLFAFDDDDKNLLRRIGDDLRAQMMTAAMSEFLLLRTYVEK